MKSVPDRCLCFQNCEESGVGIQKMAMEVEGGAALAGFNFPYWKPVRRAFAPDSVFFEAGNIERELINKQVALDLTEAEKQELRGGEAWRSSELVCPIVGCGACLKSLEDFEDHYNARHMASCSVCSRVYPTSRLLNIHVTEAHDSFFQAKVARGYAMYECLVEGCEVKLKSYKSRQQHLIDKHQFPSSFDFLKKAKPSKRQRQKILRKKAAGTSTGMEVEGDDENMENLVSAVSRLSTSDSPSSISFGRRHGRSLAFVPRSIQKDKR